MLKVPQLGLVLTTDITILIMTISEVYVASYLVVRKPKNITMTTLMIDIIMINITARWTFSFNKTTNDFIHRFTFIPHGLIIEPKNDQAPVPEKPIKLSPD